MPNRYVRESAIESDAVNSLSWQAEVFWRRLINRVDDFGRYTANTKLLLASIFPLQMDRVSVRDIERLLAECEASGLLFRYQAQGKPLLVMNKWEKGRAKFSDYGEPSQDIVKRMQTFVYKCGHTHTNVPYSDSDSDSDPEADSGNGAHAPEVPAFEEAHRMTMNAAIPEPFSRFVYEDWVSRSGKDGNGVVVAWLPYVTKRWRREQVEWVKGTHNGVKNGKAPDRAGPTLKDVQAYSKDKWPDESSWNHWAISFHTFWNDPKRNWKRKGKEIDWQVEFSEQVSKWRAKK